MSDDTPAINEVHRLLVQLMAADVADVTRPAS